MIVIGAALLALLLPGTLSGQPLRPVEQDAVPTLVPPTPIPTLDAGMRDALAADSALARIQAEGRVRVGILFNEPPFGLLNIRGEVSGFDADLARSLGDLWGVDVDLVQVTRQTAADMLLGGRVDMLVAAQVHERQADQRMEFSHTYYRGAQAVMVRIDDGAAALADMANRRLGVVMARPGADAVQAWQQRTGLSATVEPFPTLERAYVALVAGEIDGVVSSRVNLNTVLQPGAAKILEEDLLAQPYAIAVRRQDASLRALVNRSLQFLARNGRLNEIYQSNFPGSTYPPGLIPEWANLGDDAPQPGQYAATIAYPAQYTVARLQAGQPLRVGGIQEVPADAHESEKRLAAVNRAVVEALAARWDVPVEYVDSDPAGALDLLAAGQVDLVAGAAPDWARADQADFTGAYLLHGDRLLVEKDSDIESFNELRGGRWVGIFASEPGAADRVNALAESVDTAVNIYTVVREEDVWFHILEDQNMDVAFGDSLKLIPHVQAYPDNFRLTTRCPNCDPWYSRQYVAFGVPLNDVDFRLLVEYTLQELFSDGTLPQLLGPVMLPEDIPALDVWPGPATFLGYSLRQTG
jgi:ABC-type amino acid transport substrate-binding protein